MHRRIRERRLGISAQMRLAHVFRRGGGFVRRIADAAFQGVRLGMLDRAGINAVTAAFYARSTSRYYDDAYNAGGLFDWEQTAIGRYFKAAKTLILGSAGAGRELLGLSARGFVVSAFECSPLLVEEARRRLARDGIATPFILAAPDDVPNLGSFDGAVLGWGAYTHIAGSAARVAFLRRLRAQIVAGGPILLSFRARRGDSRSMRMTAALGTAIRRLRGHADAVEVGDTLSGSFCHYATQHELERELDQAGFRLVHFGDTPYGHAVGIRVEKCEP